MSPQDNRGVHPYLQKRFYTLHLFSTNPRLTEWAKGYYRALEQAEEHELDRMKKDDHILWKCKR